MGEFPAQNDVNLAPAPSLPQVRIKLLFLFVNLTDSPAADIQSDFNITINAQLKCETVNGDQTFYFFLICTDEDIILPLFY